MYQNGDFARWRRHPWHGLEAVPEGADEGIVQAYIEMLPSDTVKYELDKESGFLMVDRPQRTSATPPALYGFIPKTYCAEEVAKRCEGVTVADGDPLDICIYSERLINRADIILNARVVGGIQMIEARLTTKSSLFLRVTTSGVASQILLICQPLRLSDCSTTSRHTNSSRAKRSTLKLIAFTDATKR